MTFRKFFSNLFDSGPTESGVFRGPRLSQARLLQGARYVITFSPAGYKDVQLDWIGVLDDVDLTREEVRTGFQTWLDTAPRSPDGVPLRTIRAWINGISSEITFRTDWISGFSVEQRG
jgi:hypothetical protein